MDIIRVEQDGVEFFTERLTGECALSEIGISRLCDVRQQSWFYPTLCEMNLPVLRPLRDAAINKFLSQWSW
jgi:hypothetical protein